MALMGVHISWLELAKNFYFALKASSTVNVFCSAFTFALINIFFLVISLVTS